MNKVSVNTMRSIAKLDSGWTFHTSFDPSLITEAAAGEPVRLPHNAVDLELTYLDERSYQKEFGYQRALPWQPEYAGREITLEFDGAMANTVVWLNGRQVAAHKDGYTPFSVRLTGLLNENADNLLTVKIDGSENPEIPPFGGQIDYLTYAGIYRDVWLKLTDAVSIQRLKVQTSGELSDAKGVQVTGFLSNPTGVAITGTALVELCALDGRVLHQCSAEVNGDIFTAGFDGLAGLQRWELDAPTLYQVRVTLNTSAGSDQLATRFGFRTAAFTTEGFFLNGQPLKIRGLNRHQSFPYVGYAMGRRVQRKDADIVKHQLKCNLVRTSHYPQSKYFLDRCDEIGLLVLEEIPGWQHIGGQAWQDESVENVRRMIERDWNHPSIICWGVRINESPDHHEFYARTTALARELDSRTVGGIRCIDNSELLEDVYTMNDFFNGAGPDWLAGREPVPLRRPRAVTGLDHDVPYLVTEHTGHMFPTKRIDPEVRQAEHVSRHLQVMNASYGDPAIAGAIGWCMADYNTHKDFGAGDRVCHHGVLDIFREPKFAGHVYASQCSPAEQVVLEPVSYWARGEKDRCEVLPLVVLTNCDYVELTVGDMPPTRAEPDRERYPHLPHAPVIFDERHISVNAFGAWGMLWRDAVFTGYVDGKPVATVAVSGSPLPTKLQVQVDDTVLRADEKDATRVIVRALDQAGRLLPFLDDIATIEVSGAAKLLGPALLPIKGGVTGFWLETTGAAGEISVRVRTRRLGEQALTLRAD
ncbi:glycoside hydrolase family 2 TIM barrel-domain containing protein [Paucibacter sp. R3-3]|uniref:Glycoside hydrolase family 2 TIM barrel-domain containing protein n=1 Tax=Roseateles agri TaxID=3098619 RepID=A0ABU5DG57_9BURK|nr:glycoside hydrolase family 2 TIM barrel-domain containing protein [Paucibacter sp. R3-3]MDY0745256.1 glycoside hydrolase family 2 TIM barrel-domain containing protein [Paucibacter sp. R3-3]